MECSYIYCNHCGFEAFDLFVAYVRSTADADQYECPECKKETSNVEHIAGSE